MLIDDTKNSKKINFISNKTNKGYEESLKMDSSLYLENAICGAYSNNRCNLELPPKNLYNIIKIKT